MKKTVKPSPKSPSALPLRTGVRAGIVYGQGSNGIDFDGNPQG